MRYPPTILAAALALAGGLAAPALQAQGTSLPDIGSSAGELLSPREEQEYGAYTLYQLRRYDYVLEDPLLDAWLGGMGHRLGSASDKPEQSFTFFMMRDRQINAFATLGGYVGMNAGTVLSARNEDEVAGVLAHEISHVTQRHVLRAVERAQKDRIPIMLATLGVIIAAQQGRGNEDPSSRGSSRDQAIQAAVIGGQALAVQRQIDYTRTTESEADRVGINTLYRSGYNVDGMADFFERMQRLTRSDASDAAPSYLQTHPLGTTRLSEARERADRLRREPPTSTPRAAATSNLLLPANLQPRAPTAAAAPVRQFEWARERLRVLTAPSLEKAVRESQALLTDAGPRATDAQRYGLALAQSRNGYPAAAEDVLVALAKAYPDNLFIGLALADNASSARNEALARRRYEDLLARHPHDRTVIVSYATALNALGSAEAGRRAQAILRPILPENAEDPLFQKNYGRASELAGDAARAGEAFAEAAWLNGRAEDALNQLNALLRRTDLSYIQRSRIEARVAEITPEVLEMKRRKIRPQDLPGDHG